MKATALNDKADYGNVVKNATVGVAQKTKPRRSGVLPEEFAGNDEPTKQTLTGLS
jgi:hypothetical protein